MSDADMARGERIALRWAAQEARAAAASIEARASTRASKGAVKALRALADEIDPAGPAAGHIPDVGKMVAPPVADAYAQSRAQGYTGDECRECGSMRMVRNGTCLKCETCGATTGCS